MDAEDKESSSDEMTEKSISLDVYDSSDENTEGEVLLVCLQNIVADIHLYIDLCSAFGSIDTV